MYYFFHLFSADCDTIMPNMEKKEKFTPNRELKLLDQVRETLRYYHYAYSTEKAYCQWILRFIYYNKEGNGDRFIFCLIL